MPEASPIEKITPLQKRGAWTKIVAWSVSGDHGLEVCVYCVRMEYVCGSNESKCAKLCQTGFLLTGFTGFSSHSQCLE